MTKEKCSIHPGPDEPAGRGPDQGSDDLPYIRMIRDPVDQYRLGANAGWAFGANLRFISGEHADFQ